MVCHNLGDMIGLTGRHSVPQSLDKSISGVGIAGAGLKCGQAKIWGARFLIVPALASQEPHFAWEMAFDWP
jgi:hypothetical protein